MDVSIADRKRKREDTPAPSSALPVKSPKSPKSGEEEEDDDDDDEVSTVDVFQFFTDSHIL